MKRKVYSTPRERKADQLIGFWAFPLVNVPLWLISQILDSQLPAEVAAIGVSSVAQNRTLVSALPWLVNGLVLVLAFLFRPQSGIGYVAFIATAFAVVIMLGSLFVAACFVSFISVVVISQLITTLFDRHSAEVIAQVAIALCFVLFFVLMLGGIYGLAQLGRSLWRDWRSSEANTSDENNGNTD